MEIVRKVLSAAELYPVDRRYNDTTGEVEYSGDGGTTWTPAPGLDPRGAANGVPILTAAPRCDAAATMVALIRSMIDPLISGIGTGTSATILTAAIMTVMVILGFFGMFLVFIVALVAAALAGGYEALTTGFTETFWNDLECYFFCALEDDGRITDAGVADVQADVVANYPGLVSAIMGYMFQSLGAGGLNSAQLAVGVVTGDCGACPDCPDDQCKTFMEGFGLNGLTPSMGASTACVGTASYDAVNDRLVGGICPSATNFRATGGAFTCPFDVKYMYVEILSNISNGTFRISKNGVQVATVVNPPRDGTTFVINLTPYNFLENDPVLVTMETAQNPAYLYITMITVCNYAL